MNIKEKLKNRDITDVQYSASKEGLHIRVNGFKEFTLTKNILLQINAIVFDNEIKENEDKHNTSEPTTPPISKEGI